MSFLYPHLLWGLTLLTVPVILHCLNYRRPRQVVFPTIRFLHRDVLPSDGRRRLRDLLLLLLRLLILASAILCLARPQWLPPKIDSHNHTQTTIILLDNSASLTRQGRLETGKKLAKAVLDNSATDQFGAILYDRKILKTIPPSTDRAAVLKLLADWQPGYTTSQPAEALRAALALFPEQGRKKLLLASDFQQDDWRDVTTTLPEDIELELLPALGDDAQENAPDASLLAVRCAPLGQNRCRCLVTLHNYSPREITRSLTVTIGDASQSRACTLPAAADSVETFVFEVPDTPLPGQASLNPDCFDRNDAYHFWANLHARIKTLLIIDPEANATGNVDAFFLLRALTAEQDDLPGRFDVETIVADTLFTTDFTSYQLICLPGSAERLAPADWERLRQFVQRGGLLLKTPGSAPAVAFQHLRSAGLTRATAHGLSGQDSHDNTRGLGWLNPESPLGHLFADGNTSDLFLFRLRKFLRITPAADDTVILKTLDGFPALLSSPCGKGQSLLFAFAFNPAWGDFPLAQTFLPVIRELAIRSVSIDASLYNLPCGTAPDAWETSTPDLMALDSTEVSSERPATAQYQGIFLQFNTPTAESSPALLTPGDLQRYLKRPTATSLKHPRTDAKRQPKPLWPLLAGILAIAILLEAAVRHLKL